MLKRINKWLACICGACWTVAASAQAEDGAVDQLRICPVPENQPAKVRFSKEELVASLQQMNRDPRSVQTVCAMCYEMVALPDQIEYHCPVCGQVTAYGRTTDEGALVEGLPNLSRTLADMPYQVTLDSTRLCSRCGQGKPHMVVAHMKCFDCGKDFAWDVLNGADMKAMAWLFLKPPVKEIDTRQLGYNLNDGEQAIKKGALYIRDHVFCAECREKVNWQ